MQEGQEGPRCRPGVQAHLCAGSCSPQAPEHHTAHCPLVPHRRLSLGRVPQAQQHQGARGTTGTSLLPLLLTMPSGSPV